MTCFCVSELNAQTFPVNFSFSTSYSGQGYNSDLISGNGQIAYDSSQLTGVGGEWVFGSVANFSMSPHIGGTVFNQHNVDFSLYLHDGRPWVLRVGGSNGGGANTLHGNYDDFLLQLNIHHLALSNFSLSDASQPNIGPFFSLDSTQVDFNCSSKLNVASEPAQQCCKSYSPMPRRQFFSRRARCRNSK